MDNSDNLWLTGHYYGIGMFDGEKCTIYNTQNSELPSDQWNIKIIVDENDNKWIGSLMWLVKFDENNWETWETGNPVSAYNSINDLEFDYVGNLFIGANWGLGKFSGNSVQTFSEINNEVLCLEYDENNILWIGTHEGGLISYDGSSFTKFDTSNFCLPCNTIYSIKFDSQGNKWLGTYKGLVKFNNSACEIFDTTNSNIADNLIFALEIDNENNIWIPKTLLQTLW